MKGASLKLQTESEFYRGICENNSAFFNILKIKIAFNMLERVCMKFPQFYLKSHTQRTKKRWLENETCNLPSFSANYIFNINPKYPLSLRGNVAP